MKELDKIYFKERKSFRDWLQENFDKSSGFWMIFYKKHTNKKCIKYNEALEEALCFGWIDSIIKKIDADSYVRKFTPRTNLSNWSDVNKKLVLSLIEKGIMTKAGLEKIDIYRETGKINWKKEDLENCKKRKNNIPDFIIKTFAKNEPALTNFNNLAQTYKRHYVLWITSAKKEETIQRRLQEAIQLLKENNKLASK